MKKTKLEGYCPPDARLNTDDNNAPPPKPEYVREMWEIIDDGKSTKLIKGTNSYAQNRKTLRNTRP